MSQLPSQRSLAKHWEKTRRYPECSFQPDAQDIADADEEFIPTALQSGEDSSANSDADAAQIRACRDVGEEPIV